MLQVKTSRFRIKQGWQAANGDVCPPVGKLALVQKHRQVLIKIAKELGGIIPIQQITRGLAVANWTPCPCACALCVACASLSP